MYNVVEGDALEQLGELQDSSAQSCITSPPYWGLRDYGCDGQLGQEKTPEEYVESMVEIFSELRRVLRDDGTLWLNLGDTYFEKQLAGIPWRVAFALQADGWILRQDIIWHKPTCMPEPVKDRCTKAHEYIFLLTKNPKYYYNADAIKTKAKEYKVPDNPQELEGVSKSTPESAAHSLNNGRGRAHFAAKYSNVQPGGHSDTPENAAAHGMNQRRGTVGVKESEEGFQPGWANKRSVWSMATARNPDAHFAVFPDELVENCLRAGSKEGDTILDPFAGSGTTGCVAVRELRNFVGIELNPNYVKLARERIYMANEQNRMFV